MPARLRVIRESYYSARSQFSPILSTTLEASRPADKPNGIYCNLLNNRVLARRARTLRLCPGSTVASYQIPD